jgi:hypothetical protein
VTISDTPGGTAATARPDEVAVWNDALAAYEKNLEHLRELLRSDDGATDTRCVWPPPQLPTTPVPPELEARATTLLGESHTLIDAIAQRMVALPSPRSRRSHRRPNADGPRWSTTL